MFTRNPINGADERVIEASWGLGEAVVAGLVIPDHFRIDRSGQVLERTAGLKRIAIRTLPEGGTVEEEVAAELAEQLCLDDDQLAELHRLAGRCEEVYGPDRDIEWAFAGGAALPAPVPGDHADGRPGAAVVGRTGRHRAQRPALRRPRPQGGREDRRACSRSAASRRARR